jgi:hypothetical protein
VYSIPILTCFTENLYDSIFIEILADNKTLMQMARRIKLLSKNIHYVKMNIIVLDNKKTTWADRRIRLPPHVYFMCLQL